MEQQLLESLLRRTNIKALVGALYDLAKEGKEIPHLLNFSEDTVHSFARKWTIACSCFGNKEDFTSLLCVSISSSSREKADDIELSFECKLILEGRSFREEWKLNGKELPSDSYFIENSIGILGFC